MNKILESLKKLNWPLFASLLILGLVPTIYTTARTAFLGQLPGDYAYSIAGQLTWVSLVYEIIDEMIILPLFFLLGSPQKDKAKFSNRVKTGLIISAVVYGVLALIILLFAEPFLSAMATDTSILAESATYIRIEAIANIFGILYRFLLVAIVAFGKEKYVYILTGLRLILSLLLDTFFISSFSFSLNLGVSGIGYSNIIVNAILSILAWLILVKNGVICKSEKLSFTWFNDFAKIGGISGLESLVRNVAYILMVSRMVNMVGEQGTYWVANNFIWGWMLLPVLQLGELIKQETSSRKENMTEHYPGYMYTTGIIVVLWIITIPLYKPFMSTVLGFEDVDKLFTIVMMLFVPYIAFAFQNVFDSIFYGRGRTDYMLFESIVTNSIYYGGMFIAYLAGLWTPTLTGIILMFGIGNIFDAVVSALAFRHYVKNGDETFLFKQQL